ncbi:MAG: Crp/Fnr family transcriptional regulator [Candidatus Phaeomarinobacter sp.]
MGKSISDVHGVVPAVLSQVDLFAAQTQDVRERLCAAAQLWQFTKGETVAEAVEPVEAVFILVKGTFLNERVFENGKRMLTAVLSPGWPLKVPAVWSGDGSPFGLTARTDAVAILVPQEAFLSVVNSDIHFLRDITTFISRQYQQDTTNLQIRTMCSLDCQLALLLAFHAQSAFHLGHEMGNGTSVEPMDVTQEEFASMLGCSRQKVIVIMRNMERKGMIQRHGRLVEITDYMMLLGLIEEDERVHPNFRKVFEAWHARVVDAGQSKD